MIATKVCAACSGTSCKIVPVTNLFKYLHNDTSETEVNINLSVNNGSEKLCKKKSTSALLQPFLPCFQPTVHNRLISFDNNSVCSSYDYC